MPANVRISVIVPTYNRAHLLRSCLDSLLAQRHRAHEIVVVDDGSTDDTTRVASDYAGKIIYIKQENGGPGAARNTGAHLATGDYLVFLDSDDYWWPWTLEALDQVLSEHAPRLATYAHQVFTDEETLSAINEEPLEQVVYKDFFCASKDRLLFSTSSSAVRRSDFLSAGGFNTRIRVAEDIDLAMRMGDAGGFVHIKSPVLIGLRRHAVSLMQDTSSVYEGMRHLILEEGRGAYAGGPTRALDRRRHITYVTRGASMRLASHRKLAAAWRVYAKTLSWHLRSRRFAYALGFPLASARAAWRGATTPWL